MNKTVSTQMGGFTPIFDYLNRKYKTVTTALVFGVMWRFCQMQDGVCKASLETIAEKSNLDKSTVIRHIKVLVDDGFLIDTNPNPIPDNLPHVYRDAGKVGMKVEIAEFNPDNAEGVAGSDRRESQEATAGSRTKPPKETRETKEETKESREKNSRVEGLEKIPESDKSEIKIEDLSLPAGFDILDNIVLPSGEIPGQDLKADAAENAGKLTDLSAHLLDMYSEGKPQKRIDPAAEAMRERGRAILFEMGRNIQGDNAWIENAVNKFIESYRPLARAFIVAFGRAPLQREVAFWNSEFTAWISLKLTPGDIDRAMKYMSDPRHPLTIKSPKSITATAEDLKRKEEGKITSLDARDPREIQREVDSHLNLSSD